NITDDNPCDLCRNQNRRDGTICVIEGPGDQLALEESGVFKGRYHVLHGVLSPLDGIGPEDLKIGELLARLENEEITEVILATNPTTEGEATSSFLCKLLLQRNRGLKISRIALGIPMGGNVKHMDCMTLEHALKSRVPIK
ncbi:MAG: recombination protein RecR, partial [Deltaproteobacteria bacterium]|nr:recombination protein RecR [Deltaproteobacteria bacterium]